MANLAIFSISIAIIIATGFMLYRLRTVIIDDRRMKGFYPLCVMALAWIAAATIDLLAAPEHFAYTYVTKVAFSIVVPYCTFWFILNFIESRLLNSRVMKIYLIAAPAADILLLFTSPLHRLYFVNLDPPVFPSTVPPTAILFWIHVSMIAIGVLFFYMLIFRYIIKNFRRYPLLVITGIGVLIPFLLNIAFVVGLFGLNYDLSPIGYFFTIMLFAYFSYTEKMRNYNPDYYRDSLAAITKSPVLYAGYLEEAVRMIAEKGCNALNVQCIAIWKLSDDMKLLKKSIVYEVDTYKTMLQDTIDMDANLEYRDIVFSERLFVVNDVGSLKNILSSSIGAKESSLCAYMDAPIRVSGKLYGVISIEQHKCKAYPERREWTLEEQSFASSLVDFVTVAIENSERNRYAGKLRNALAFITKSPAIYSGEMETAADVVVQAACEAMEASQVEFWITLPDENALESLAVFDSVMGKKDARGEIYDLTIRPEYANLLKSERLIVMNNVDEMMKILPYLRESNIEMCSSLDAPVFLDGKLVGTLGIQQIKSEKYPDGREWSIEEQNFVSSLADLMALAISGFERRRAYDEAELANQTKTIFLAKMSHEIRTPMNAIIGMAELAMREHMTDITRDHISTVKQAGVNLLSLINDILDFSKIESGTMQIIAAEYSLSSLINDVISIIRIKAFDSQIRFAVNIDSKIPNALIGDEARIRQVLINVLSNAVKFTETGFASLTISGEITGEDSMYLTMVIKDSGRGIKEEDLERLFEDYYQLENEPDKFNEGAGLGLAISRNIVKAMNGEITVKSKYGEGSTFSVILPQKIFKPDRIAVVENPHEKNVLLCERREIYAVSIAKTLVDMGVAYDLVADRDGFFRILNNKTFSFIFISNAFFEKFKEEILRSCGNSQIVLITEFGESIPTGNWNVLSLPAHAVSIASILNHQTINYSYNYSEEMTVRFTAPAANALIVDDINTNLKVAEGLLLPYDMNVDLCTNGFEAIEAVRSKKYDIIFMDHRMPGIDGVETTDRIRKMNDEDPYYGSVPIIALTANAVSGMKEMFLQSGFNEFMSKPIDIVKLNNVLEKFIPKEKQAGSSGESRSSKKENRKINIKGVDINKGIMLTGGTEEFYMETLATFHVDGFERIAEIRKCHESNDVQSYITNVHAVKSASANIGADIISEAAGALEMAAISEDMNYIKINNESFLIKLEQLLAEISNVLVSYWDDNKAAGTIIDHEVFKSLLERLKTALEVMDIDEMNLTIDNLLNTPQGADTLTVIRNISKHILLVEYEEAVVLIDTLLEKYINDKR